MLLHQKVTNFNAYLTYKRLKVLFFAQKKTMMKAATIIMVFFN